MVHLKSSISWQGDSPTLLDEPVSMVNSFNSSHYQRPDLIFRLDSFCFSFGLLDLSLPLARALYCQKPPNTGNSKSLLTLCKDKHIALSQSVTVRQVFQALTQFCFSFMNSHYAGNMLGLLVSPLYQAFQTGLYN